MVSPIIYNFFEKYDKILIFKFHQILDENHKVAKVLYNHPDLREEIDDRLETVLPEDSELSSVPDLSIEMYTEEMKVTDPLVPPENPFD